MQLRSAILGFLLVVTPALGSAEPDVPLPDPGIGTFERVLLPVVIGGLVGQGGSVWSTHLSVRNEADAPVIVFSSQAGYFCHTQIGCYQPGVPLPAHSSAEDPTDQEHFPLLWVDLADRGLQSDDLGLFLYVDRVYSDFVHLNLVLHQTGEGARDAGTEIPVIREREMKSGPLELLGVPIGSDGRTTLRLYAGYLADGSTARFRIEIFQGDSEVAAVDETKQLAGSGFHLLSPDYPDYLVVPDIAAAYPQLSSLTPLRIVITPLSSGASYWGFASVADNVTQHVTLITPH